MKSYRHPALAEVPLQAVLQALADPGRLLIVRKLLGEEEIACNEAPLEISKATLSHHFEVLREAGLIRTRTEGTRCLNSLRRKEVEERFPGLLDLVVLEKPLSTGVESSG